MNTATPKPIVAKFSVKLASGDRGNLQPWLTTGCEAAIQISHFILDTNFSFQSLPKRSVVGLALQTVALKGNQHKPWGLCGSNAESTETELRPWAQAIGSGFCQPWAKTRHLLVKACSADCSSLLASDCLDRRGGGRGDKTQPLNRGCPAHFSRVITVVCPHRKVNPN